MFRDASLVRGIPAGWSIILKVGEIFRSRIYLYRGGVLWRMNPETYTAGKTPNPPYGAHNSVTR